MMNIDLKLENGVAYDEAERAAREAVEATGGNFALMAWYDKARGIGAPSEACSLESWKCVRDYAENHEAGVRVAVNDDAYEFFFSKVPIDAMELDTDGIEESHAGIAVDEFNNVQGG